jgi:hypothetical protein
LGGPPKCREGQSEGSIVEVLPILGPEGHYQDKESINNWTGLPVRGVYAVYQVSENVFSDENFPAGEYAILLISNLNHYPQGFVVHVDQGEIVRIDNIFIQTLDDYQEILENEAEAVILPPPN